MTSPSAVSIPTARSVLDHDAAWLGQGADRAAGLSDRVLQGARASAAEPPRDICAFDGCASSARDVMAEAVDADVDLCAAH